jgi:hypothetical protein
MEPLPEPAPDPDVAAEGMRAVDVILRSTEAEVARIATEAQKEVRRLGEETDAVAVRGAAERREQLARVRADLLDRATLLAAGFEEIFDLLESADAALAAGAPPHRGHPVAAAPHGEAAGGIRMVLRERRRVTVAHDVEPAPEQSLPSPAPAPPAALPRRRRRWWRLWQRHAA